VFVIGNTGTVVYVIRTSDGLVMIDALGANQVDTCCCPASRRSASTPHR
jgi:hypothetical protein